MIGKYPIKNKCTVQRFFCKIVNVKLSIFTYRECQAVIYKLLIKVNKN